MKLEHINKIKGNIAIKTSMKSANILDGAYRSIFKGKSLNFEELREYTLGDSVKDIDWRASARNMNLLVKEHIADKKHNIMFILDSKYAMNANCTTDSLKRDIAVETMGTIAYLAYKNGDNIGATYISCDTPKYFPFKGALFNIENVLTNYDEDMKRQNIKKKYNNSLNLSLDYITNYITRRTITFIITDIVGLEELDEEKVKTLIYRSDVMIIVIWDINLFNSKSYDVDNRKYFSEMFLKNKKLLQIENEEKEKVFNELKNKYTKYKITTIDIRSKEEEMDKIIELLERHKDANT